MTPSTTTEEAHAAVRAIADHLSATAETSAAARRPFVINGYVLIIGTLVALVTIVSAAYLA